MDHRRAKSSCMRSAVILLNGELHVPDFERFHLREKKKIFKAGIFQVNNSLALICLLHAALSV